jgi:hypothetical protein
MSMPLARIGGAIGLALLATATAAQVGRGQGPPSPGGASPRQAPSPARGAAARPALSSASTYAGPRTPDRKPDLNGIWQVLGTAHWNLEAHSASEGVPAGYSVVEGGTIPYQASALARRNENFKNRLTADPLRKCYLPGVPRAMYLPLPFEITQTPKHILIAYEFAHATRTIFLDGTPHLEDLDFWMGDARGKWEADTLVIDTTSLGDKTWFDEAGNFHSDALKVVERFTPTDATHIAYEATIDDAKVFTRPWKMAMTLYRRVEKNLELLDYECAEHVYEKLFKGRGGQP